MTPAELKQAWNFLANLPMGETEGFTPSHPFYDRWGTARSMFEDELQEATDEAGFEREDFE